LPLLKFQPSYSTDLGGKCLNGDHSEELGGRKMGATK